MKTSVAQDLHVRRFGAISEEDEAYLRLRIGDALRFAQQPVLHARSKLTWHADPTVRRPAVVQVNVDLNGRFLRAQAARPTMREAIDEVHDRLRDRLQRASGDWEMVRGSHPAGVPRQSWHGSPWTERPDLFVRPRSDRRIVRHKSFGLPRQTVEGAIRDMSMLDYSFFLFTEDRTAVDSLLCRSFDGAGWLLLQTDPRPGEVSLGSTPVRVEPVPAPVLSASDAVDRLELAGWPFVFFRDVGTQRGCVLYHRYDGHYGLITPATE